VPDIKSKNAPRLPISVLLDSMKDIFGTLTTSPTRYPDIFVTGVPGLRKVYMVNHPDLAQHILQKNYGNYNKGKGYEVLSYLLGKGLVTNEGDNWHKQRTLIQPAFHRGTLKKISEIVTTSTSSLLRGWKEKEGTTFNFTREMAGLTIDIVAKSLFTTDVTADNIQTIWRNVNALNESANRILRNPFSLPWFLPVPRYVKMRKYIAELDDMVYGIINRRKLEKNPPHDLLQLLLESRYDDGTAMSDLQIRDEVMTIFLAGHETTVNALSWTWYLLKQNKSADDKLKEESLKYAAVDPVFDDVPNLVYGKQVTNESMRCYPPVPVVGRNAKKDDEAGGYHISAGAEVGINVTGLHHHPAYWPDPMQFKPERFENFDLKGDKRFVFMPFGGGPRICIGNSFAMMEMQLINAMLSARVEMELISRDIKPIALVTLKPGDGVEMKLVKVKV
jgi:cytochrome P450